MSENEEEEEVFVIHWVINAFGVEEGSTGFHVGFCERTGEPFSVSVSQLTPALVDSVTVRGGECTDGKWCLCRSCEYAPVEYDSIVEYTGLEKLLQCEEDLDLFLNLLEIIAEAVGPVTKYELGYVTAYPSPKAMAMKKEE